MRRFCEKGITTVVLFIAGIGIGFWPALSYSGLSISAIPLADQQKELSPKQVPSRAVKWIYTTGNTIFSSPIIAKDDTSTSARPITSFIP